MDNSSQDACYRYNQSLIDADDYCKPYYKSSDANDSSLLEKCDSWNYNTSVFESTIVIDVTMLLFHVNTAVLYADNSI